MEHASLTCRLTPTLVLEETPPETTSTNCHNYHSCQKGEQADGHSQETFWFAAQKQHLPSCIIVYSRPSLQPAHHRGPFLPHSLSSQACNAFHAGCSEEVLATDCCAHQTTDSCSNNILQHQPSGTTSSFLSARQTSRITITNSTTTRRCCSQAKTTA